VRGVFAARLNNAAGRLFGGIGVQLAAHLAQVVEHCAHQLGGAAAFGAGVGQASLSSFSACS
jgi:hypothetical protein